MSELTLYRGEVFDFIDSPLNRKDAYRYFPDGALVVREGEIVDCGPFEEIKGRYTDYELVEYSGKLLMPGFIDSHIHYPQAEIDRKSTRLNSSHASKSRMPSSA